MMTIPTFDIDYVRPHSSLQCVECFIYLNDPLGEGDEKVGCIYHSQHNRAKYSIQWEWVPVSDEFQWREYNTIEECEEYVSQNILKWWSQYLPLKNEDYYLPQDSDPDPSLSAKDRNPSLN